MNWRWRSFAGLDEATATVSHQAIRCHRVSRQRRSPTRPEKSSLTTEAAGTLTAHIEATVVAMGEGQIQQGRVHYAWVVAITTFFVLLLSASVRGVFGLLIMPLHHEFGWSRSAVSAATLINLVLYGLMGPVAAALMVRFGMRKVVIGALTLIAASAVMSSLAWAPWHLWLSWGVGMGIGQGSLAIVLAASVSATWFVERRGMVSGILTAAGTAGTLIFLPLNERLVDHYSWRFVAITICATTLAAIPLVLLFVHNNPEDKGLRAYGAPEGYRAPERQQNPLRNAARGLAESVHSGIFWVLLGSFTVCGITTSGLVLVHFPDAAHDHGIARSAAAGLFVLIGIFELLGALASGWLTDRFDPRRLLFGYYLLRGLSLLVFDQVLALGSHHLGLLMVLIVYGLDWVATVPPTIALANQLFGRDRGPIVFGWLFAGHQLGGGLAAWLAAWSRDASGSFQMSFMIGGITAIVAAFACLRIGRTPVVADQVDHIVADQVDHGETLIAL